MDHVAPHGPMYEPLLAVLLVTLHSFADLLHFLGKECLSLRMPFIRETSIEPLGAVL